MSKQEELEKRLKALEEKLSIDTELPNKIIGLSESFETSKTRLDEIKTNAETQNNELQQSLGVIKTTKEETDKELGTTKNSLDKYLKEAEDKSQSINKIYEAAGITSQSLDFSKRAADLVWSIRGWLVLFLISLIGTLWLSIIYVPRWVGTGLNIYQVFLEKLIILAPLATLITFFGLQYGRNRRLYERYRAKAIFSVTIKPLILEMLPKISDDYWKKFARKIFEDIYSDPDHCQPKKIKMKFGKNLLEISGEYEDLQKEIIKEVINKEVSDS